MAFAKPQRGLVPIGGNFYATPDTPQDPNYDEPFAAPFSFDRKKGIQLNAPFELEKELVLDHCNIGISGTPVLFFMRLPEFQVVLRNPDCTPPLQPGYDPPDEYDYEEPAPKFGNGTNNPWLIYEVSNSITTVKIDPARPDYYYFEKSENNSSVNRIRFPDTGYIPGTNSYYAGTLFAQKFSEYNCSDDVVTERSHSFYTHQKNNSASFTYDPVYFTLTGGVRTKGGTSFGGGLAAPMFIKISQTGDFTNYKTTRINNDAGGNYRGYRSSSLNCVAIQLSDIDFIKPPPPPRKRKKEKCCMCCPENQAQLAELIRLQRLQLKRIGDFPANVPARLNTGDDKNTMVQIQSIGGMMAWLARNLDAMIGEFPLSIKIEDSDLTQVGNQDVTIKPPNVAETLSEILGLLLVMKTEGGATLKAGLNTMIEAGSIRQTSAMNYDLLDGIAEYLGFKQEQIQKELGLTFNPGKELLDELLQPTTIKYKTIENTDKKDINDVFTVLLEHSARWNAQNFRNIGTDNPKQKLRDILISGVDIGKAARDAINLKRVTDANNTPGSPTPDLIPESNFDTFIEDAENQFNTVQGATDITNPYGKDRDNRPKITQIGKTEQGDE